MLWAKLPFGRPAPSKAPSGKTWPALRESPSGMTSCLPQWLVNSKIQSVSLKRYAKKTLRYLYTELSITGSSTSKATKLGAAQSYLKKALVSTMPLTSQDFVTEFLSSSDPLSKSAVFLTNE